MTFALHSSLPVGSFPFRNLAAGGARSESLVEAAIAHLQRGLATAPDEISIHRGTPGQSVEPPQGATTDAGSTGVPADWVSDAELRIAAGASPAGADDRTIYRIYGRYAQAIEGLAAHLEPSLKEVAKAAVQSIDGMQEIFARNNFKHLFHNDQLARYIQSEWQKNGHILIPAFSKSHALLMQVEACEGGAVIRLYNSGEGLEQNHGLAPDGRKRSIFVEYRVAAIREDQWADLLDLGTTDHHNNSRAQDVYRWLENLPGSRRVEVPASEMTWQTR